MRHLLLLSMALLALSGCGGGGGSTPTPLPTHWTGELRDALGEWHGAVELTINTDGSIAGTVAGMTARGTLIDGRLTLNYRATCASGQITEDNGHITGLLGASANNMPPWPVEIDLTRQ